MLQVVEDPVLSAQVEVLPPKVLTVDGVERRLRRAVTPEEAVRFPGRGLRSFLLSSGFGAEVDADVFSHAISGYRSDFDGMGAGHPPEAWAHVYGRRHPRAQTGMRIVVACIVALGRDQEDRR